MALAALRRTPAAETAEERSVTTVVVTTLQGTAPLREATVAETEGDVITHRDAMIVRLMTGVTTADRTTGGGAMTLLMTAAIGLLVLTLFTGVCATGSNSTTTHTNTAIAAYKKSDRYPETLKHFQAMKAAGDTQWNPEHKAK